MSLFLTLLLMLLGFLSILILLPGVLIIWIAVLLYVGLNGLNSLGLTPLILISLIALVSGTADIWLAFLGNKAAGTTRRSLWLGFAGAVIGSFLFPFIGTIIGYVAGIIIGEYQARGDWPEAIKAGLKGLATWGVSIGIQLGGGLMIILLFLWSLWP